MTDEPDLLGALHTKALRSNLIELKSLRCVVDLSPQALEALASSCVRKAYRKGEPLWRIGDPGEFVAILSQGMAQVTRHSGDEDEAIVGIFGPSDILGLSAVMKKMPYPANASALTNNTVALKCYIRPLLTERTKISTEIQNWVRDRLLQHEQILRDKIDILQAGGADARVLELIRHLSRRFSPPRTEGAPRIPIYLTRSQVGSLTNVRTETVIRLLSRWQKLGLLKWTPDGLEVASFSALENQLAKNKAKR